MARLPPPLLMVAAGLVQRTLPRRGRSSSRTVVAGGLAVASAMLAGASSRSFRREGTTVLPFHPEQSSALVTTGVNALTRNPMYVGMAGLLLAHAVYRGSWTALGPAAAFVAVIDVYQVRFEEAALREGFGDAYDAYSRAVPRWVDGRSLRAAYDRGRL
jgi:protein-S-isoprenylcysteine O-methyltransferase Ste14